jgi:3-methyl-2-oxobutanoate hydroxymethyltransferase
MRHSPSEIKLRKNSPHPLVCLTAYTTPVARILDAHVDLLLVGDSVGMVLYGMDSTVGVTLDMMINHGKAVMRGTSRACVIVDMPFGTYESSPARALENCRRIMKETGCDGIKLEGGQAMADTVRVLVSEGIPVMGHIGLLPQSVDQDGGYKIKGKTEDQIETLIKDARALTDAGAFSIVIEGTISGAAERITQAISIPTIGIGASPQCDGQILVTDDVLGLTPEPRAKFVKTYADLAGVIDTAASQYAHDVRARLFPTENFLYHLKT